MNRNWLAGVGLAALALAESSLAASLRCPDVKDVWLSAVDAEQNFNMGAAATIKLKCWQEFGLVDFDVSALKGKHVQEAWLFVKPAGGQKFGLNGGTDLKWLTLSTVSHDWVEGKAANYALDAAGNGATFRESSYQKKDWGWPGARVWDVILGNGNTLRFDGELVPATSGWLKIKIAPRLVEALVARASYGLLLMDGATGVQVNCRIASRESGNGPYLEVTTAELDASAPKTPSGIKAVSAPDWATPALGAIRVSAQVPENAFAYRVKVNGVDVARWQVPFAGSAGEIQSFPIVDLEPGRDSFVEVAAVDAAGRESPYAAASTRASTGLSVPPLPAYPFKPVGGEPKALGQAKVWAFPEIVKVSPVTGQVLHEKADADFRFRNAVWDGASATVRLAAARGEIVSFQVAVEGSTKGCGVQVSALNGPAGIDNGGVRLWRNWYVGEEAEYALPLTGTFDCPADDNGVPGQTLQTVTVDFPIPSSAKAGEYQGTVAVRCGDSRAELALKVKVYDVLIPDDVHFVPELNCYGGPGQAGSPQFIESHRLAHYHRATINRVPYDQSGRVHADWAPKVDGNGHVTDWTAYDRNLGGLLDGSWFKANPRAGVPVPVLYLPMHEGWPLDFRKHYHPGDGVPLNSRNEDERLKHNTLAKPIEDAMDPAFQEAWTTCSKDFVSHARDKGWNRTVFELYLNNKPNYGYTFWTMDEPFVALDWRCLNFFAGLFKKAIDDPEVYALPWHEALFRKGLAGMNRSRPTFLFRADVSRPVWQGSISDGLMTAMYANSGAFETGRIIRNSKQRMPCVMNVYGSCNDVNRANWESAAWCLKAYAHEFDAVLPWQSLGGPGALRKADPTALIIDAGPYGVAVASLRVHALRRGAQDCELLRLLQLKNGWSRGHIGVLVSQRIPLTGAFDQKFRDDAASVTFGSLTSQGFCELKEGVLQLLAVP